MADETVKWLTLEEIDGELKRLRDENRRLAEELKRLTAVLVEVFRGSMGGGVN